MRCAAIVVGLLLLVPSLSLGQEAKKSPHRNVITRAVGNREYVQVDTSAVTVLPGDVFLLCTDGLHGYLQGDEALTYLNLPPEKAVRALVDLANARGGRDNVTALVVYVDDV